MRLSYIWHTNTCIYRVPKLWLNIWPTIHATIHPTILVRVIVINYEHKQNFIWIASNTYPTCHLSVYVTWAWWIANTPCICTCHIAMVQFISHNISSCTCYRSYDVHLSAIWMNVLWFMMSLYYMLHTCATVCRQLMWCWCPNGGCSNGACRNILHINCNNTQNCIYISSIMYGQCDYTHMQHHVWTMWLYRHHTYCVISCNMVHHDSMLHITYLYFFQHMSQTVIGKCSTSTCSRVNFLHYKKSIYTIFLSSTIYM